MAQKYSELFLKNFANFTKFHITLLEEKKCILKFKILIKFAFICISYVHINSFIVNTNAAGE